MAALLAAAVYYIRVSSPLQPTTEQSILNIPVLSKGFVRSSLPGQLAVRRSSSAPQLRQARRSAAAAPSTGSNSHTHIPVNSLKWDQPRRERCDVNPPPQKVSLVEKPFVVPVRNPPLLPIVQIRD